MARVLENRRNQLQRGRHRGVSEFCYIVGIHPYERELPVRHIGGGMAFRGEATISEDFRENVNGYNCPFSRVFKIAYLNNILHKVAD